MTVFHFTDYRQAIRELLEIRKQKDSSWSYSRFAEALKVQKTYVSKVLKGDAHFNSDQLYLAVKCLGLSAEEGEYLSLLLEYGRSGLAERREKFRGRIREIQSERRSTRKTLRAKMVDIGSDKRFTEYYLDPMAPLVHTYLSLPDCGKNPELIRKRLGLSKKHLKRILLLLEELAIVAWNEKLKSYETLQDHLQLPGESPLCLHYQTMFRFKTIEQVRKLEPEERFLFSVTFSGNESTRNALHEEFLKYLRRAETIVKEAPAEKVFQLNFDLFPWENGSE